MSTLTWRQWLFGGGASSQTEDEEPWSASSLLSSFGRRKYSELVDRQVHSAAAAATCPPY
eukprot:3887642-Prymnesium_polylepis.1